MGLWLRRERGNMFSAPSDVERHVIARLVRVGLPFWEFETVNNMENGFIEIKLISGSAFYSYMLRSAFLLSHELSARKLSTSLQFQAAR